MTISDKTPGDVVRVTIKAEKILRYEQAVEMSVSDYRRICEELLNVSTRAAATREVVNEHINLDHVYGFGGFTITSIEK